MKTTLHINRIILRTRGLTPAAARAAANNIGPALAEGLNAGVAPGSIPHLKVSLPASSATSPAQIARHLSVPLSSAPRL